MQTRCIVNVLIKPYIASTLKNIKAISYKSYVKTLRDSRCQYGYFVIL